ncbi:MAG TPA: c-type cytochrome [Thermoanaerobaculia bacterium]|jgi:mono/diheme cytochrome c family protein|nr:c-type cytochrome [Thermoanaerobaculia bacterium]
MFVRSVAAAVFLSFAAGGVWALAADAGARPSPLFLQKCAKCHGEDGRAQTPKGKKLKAQDFTDPDFQQHKSDSRLVEAITNGTDKDMPAFGKLLTPQEIESLLGVVRSFSR